MAASFAWSGEALWTTVGQLLETLSPAEDTIGGHSTGFALMRQSLRFRLSPGLREHGTRQR